MALLTQKQLAQELGLTVSGVIAFTRKRKIPVLRISRRCVRYDLAKVLAALSQYEIKEVL